MNGFSEGRKIEEIAKREILPWLQRQGETVVDTSRFEFSRKGHGDYIIVRNLNPYTVELKAEQKYTGNLFLETWSNRRLLTPGWMITCRADLLFYFFLDTKDLYTIKLPDLQKWAFGSGANVGQVYIHDEKSQGRYDQLNDTWGRCVPISVIEQISDSFRHVSLKQP